MHGTWIQFGPRILETYAIQTTVMSLNGSQRQGGRGDADSADDEAARAGAGKTCEFGLSSSDGGSLAVGGEEGSPGERCSYMVGQFVFLLADMAPFAMGKAIDTRTTGKGGHQEILVH